MKRLFDATINAPRRQTSAECRRKDAVARYTNLIAFGRRQKRAQHGGAEEGRGMAAPLLYCYWVGSDRNEWGIALESETCMFRRRDNRQWDQPRPIKFTRQFTKNADGSVLVEFGDTKVFTTAKIEERVPAFLMGKREGWITAEYSLLPGSTLVRSVREVTRGQPSGRTSEIQRIIGRCLRAVVDRQAMGERTITIDADVLQADGGTRVASICGGFLALYDALAKLRKQGVFDELPIIEHMAGVSICQISGQLVLDPNYAEDSQAEMDSNIILTESGKILEFQLTSESKPYDSEKLGQLLDLAKKGVKTIIELQYEALGGRAAVDRYL